MTDPSIVERLVAHRGLKDVPRSEIEWLAARGSYVKLAANEIFVARGANVQLLSIVLSGLMSVYIDRGAGPHRVAEWRGGDITGYLPFSRLVQTPGDVTAEEVTELWVVGREHVNDLIRDCYHITAACVHVMVDRVRLFTSSDQQEEKMSSLGKLAAGLAHELNNPASAVARSAEGLTARLAAVDRTARALGEARLTDAQRAVVEKARTMCQSAVAAAATRTAIERADREDAIAGWLDTHGLDGAAADALAESAITLDALAELAGTVDTATLQLTVNWLVAGCETSQLATEIEVAASRIYKLVAAVKGFTYMDQASMPKPVDVERGLTDTLAVLNGKARGRSITVSLAVEPGLPTVQGFGGELNQVWANLIDNALDAAASRVSVEAGRQGDRIVVRITDDGAGIPPAILERIFDPFFTTKPVGKGTGLGLDIARRIARKHHGDLTVDSRPGRTQFCATIPVSGGAV